MKLSLNLPDDDNHSNPILKAKLPISIFNQPFTSIFTTATNSFSDLQFSVSTNFPSGPSLKLCYSPPTTTTTPFSPISVSLKSGLGLFGSPHNSPLVFSAHFSLSTASPIAIIPTFSLHFKPHLGHFYLHKRTASSSDPNPGPDSHTNLVDGSPLDSSSSSNLEFGHVYVPDPAGSMGWQEVKLEPFTGKEKEEFANLNPNDGANAHNSGIGFLPKRHLVSEDRKKGGFLRGVAVKARTVVPLSKRVNVNLRWGVNLPGDMGLKMPYLTVNKIGVERVEEVKEIKEKINENNKGDLELLKGMCFWMRRDLEIIEKENRDMKQLLQDMRSRVSTRNLRGENSSVGKTFVPASSDRSGEFGQWKSKKNDEANGLTELKKPTILVTDLESELQKAIKAAAS